MRLLMQGDVRCNDLHGTGAGLSIKFELVVETSALQVMLVPTTAALQPSGACSIVYEWHAPLH